MTLVSIHCFHGDTRGPSSTLPLFLVSLSLFLLHLPFILQNLKHLLFSLSHNCYFVSIALCFSALFFLSHFPSVSMPTLFLLNCMFNQQALFSLLQISFCLLLVPLSPSASPISWPHLCATFRTLLFVPFCFLVSPTHSLVSFTKNLPIQGKHPASSLVAEAKYVSKCVFLLPLGPQWTSEKTCSIVFAETFLHRRTQGYKGKLSSKIMWNNKFPWKPPILLLST